ncbi:RpiB/LacA/LacB family sugar-phosphate isomerase [[Mycoplasma] falconis]|nr:RpiB/LacA/LacB family sugar-phosphate isomerase [[Mycoplasma] falconis]
MKKVKITSDHAGHQAKVELANRLEKEGYEVELFGSKSADISTSYADAGIEFAEELLKDKEKDNNLYVAFCGSGIGISIALNRFQHVRCARINNEEEARLAKLHNNANILCMGGRLNNSDEIENMFHTWEKTEYEGGRHQARIDRLDEVGQKQ